MQTNDALETPFSYLRPLFRPSPQNIILAKGLLQTVRMEPSTARMHFGICDEL